MDKASVILVLSGFVMLLVMVDALPAFLDAPRQNMDDEADLGNDLDDGLFNMARRTSNKMYEDPRTKRAKMYAYTSSCISCNTEIKGYQFDRYLRGCRSGLSRDSNCLTYLVK